MDASGEWVLSMATASPGVLVRAPAMRPTTLGGVYVEGVLQSYGCEGGGADDEQGDDDKRLALAPEGVEKSGTGLDADGEDEEHQPKFPNSLGMMTPKCPNSRAMKMTAETSSESPLILILPNMKPKATIRKSAK